MLSHLSDTEWDTTPRCPLGRGPVTFYGPLRSLNQSDIRSADAISRNGRLSPVLLPAPFAEIVGTSLPGKSGGGLHRGKSGVDGSMKKKPRIYKKL